MALDSPYTYGEWYWKHSLDAMYARSESYEKTLSPILQNVLSNLPGMEELPSYLQSFLNSISTPTEPDLDTIQFRFLADIAAGLAQRILGHEVREFDYKVNSYLKNVRMTPEVANTLMLRKKIDETLWLARLQDAGFSEIEGGFVYESFKPYPTIPDIITYARYHGDPDNPWTIAGEKYDISPADRDMWDWLSIQKLNTEQVQELYKRRRWTEEMCTTEFARLGWQGIDRVAMLDLAYSVPNAMLLVQGNLLQEASKDTILQSISAGDIHPDYADTYLDAILTKPPTSDIIAYQLRKDPDLSELERELRKIGIHPNYTPLYKELAYQIPPVADIITMAVREAFTPEIAARFGQYEGLPPDFVTWVRKKGLSREWAERYWAAHWSLPSPTQGFEMLHRGVIDRNDLSLLLRALDIMPFWRDKLIQISYVPFTRIDIRRMYNLGVLSRTDVRDAYKDIGYDDKKAEQMTVFTEKLRETAEQRAKAAKERAEEIKVSTWTTSQTLSFLKKGLITQERAIAELQLNGYTGERINVYLASLTPVS